MCECNFPPKDVCLCGCRCECECGGVGVDVTVWVSCKGDQGSVCGDALIAAVVPFPDLLLSHY